MNTSALALEVSDDVSEDIATVDAVEESDGAAEVDSIEDEFAAVDEISDVEVDAIGSTDDFRGDLSAKGWTVGGYDGELDTTGATFASDQLTLVSKNEFSISGTTDSKPIKIAFDHSNITQANVTDSDWWWANFDVNIDLGKTKGSQIKMTVLSNNNVAQYNKNAGSDYGAWGGYSYLDPDCEEEDIDSFFDSWAIDGDIDVKIDTSDIANKIVVTYTTTEIDEDEEEIAMDNNLATHPVTVTANGVSVSYNQYVPYFGKNIVKGDISKYNIWVTYNGKSYKAEKGSIVRLKNGSSDKLNASLVIKKLAGSKTDETRKKAEKEIKKASKANKKALGKFPIRIYAYSLDDTTVGKLSEFTLRGKSGKYKLTFKLNGKKQTIKQNGKDSFKNKNKGTWTVSAGRITVSTNDISGSTTKFTNKSK